MQTSFTLAQLADPDVAESEKILRACVHCGFCTATCPTYVLDGNELDSPRGRIYLIKDMLENDRPATAEVALHIDRCLSCLSCMTTCPSGVHYMHLVDHARAHIERTYRRPLGDRAAARRARQADALSAALPPGAQCGACSASRSRRLPQAIGLQAASPPCFGCRRGGGRTRPLAPQIFQAAGPRKGPRGAARRLRQRHLGAADQRRRDSRARRASASKWCCRKARAAAARSSITWAASTRRWPRRAPISTPGPALEGLDAIVITTPRAAAPR